MPAQAASVGSSAGVLSALSCLRGTHAVQWFKPSRSQVVGRVGHYRLACHSQCHCHLTGCSKFLLIAHPGTTAHHCMSWAAWQKGTTSRATLLMSLVITRQCRTSHQPTVLRFPPCNLYRHPDLTTGSLLCFLLLQTRHPILHIPAFAGMSCLAGGCPEDANHQAGTYP